jgi:hypothetical protein
MLTVADTVAGGAGRLACFRVCGKEGPCVRFASIPTASGWTR